MTATLNASAVSALTEALPTPLPYGSDILTDRSAVTGKVSEAVTATFVGAVSADVALVLLDTSSMMEAGGEASPLVSAADVFRPALESATSVLGAGVLGESRIEDASALFKDAEATVYELISAGNPAGWFAIRVREQGTAVKTSATATAATESSAKLGRIHNVELGLTVAIGHKRVSVRDVLDLEPGNVMELDRSAGAPADVLLNGRLIAHGEIVVVDSDYAVRITKILDLAESVG